MAGLDWSYLWPCLCAGLYTAAGEMARLTEDNTELVSALYSNVFLPLEQLGDDPTTIITKLQVGLFIESEFWNGIIEAVTIF